MPETGSRRDKRPAVAAPLKDRRFPIVGIGASAGGLEALEKFIKHVPQRSGMAFVIIQHLDPTHKGIMPELLQRATSMAVIQVTDRLRIKPDRVYVIPPNKDMSILHGVLHLMAPEAPRGLRLPIDFFFRALAQDQRQRSVGVILSGMGTDGTLGLKAVKEHEGVVIVQEPASAKFDGMPRSAIETGLADIVGLPEELPEKIIAYFRRAPAAVRVKPFLEEKNQSALEKVAILLRSSTGHDFSLYKKSMVYRRIERRMSIHQIDGIDAYVQYLRKNPVELKILFKEMMIGVTSFFRDPASWERLRDQALPALLASRAAGQPLRAWTAACSTGEEAYSLAIVFKEALQRLRPKAAALLHIFATDLDADAIDKARQGVFPANIAADVSPERLSRFFVKQGDGYRVSNEIREMVVFAQQNIIMEPPFTKLDILSCRNLLIYLDAELQKKLLPLFHYSLNPGGILFLGNAETIGSFETLFAPFDLKSRLYARREWISRAAQVDFPVSSPAVPAAAKAQASRPAANLQSLMEQLLLQRYCPAAVVVNDLGDILYISGRTGKYLEPAAGKANWNVFVMAREGIRYELAAAFKKATRQGGAVTVKNVKLGGGAPRVDITVQSLSEPAALRGMILVVFSDVSPSSEKKGSEPARPPAARGARLDELEGELARARDELQTTREEMQTSQEELKSANEEMQSTNEELQSTNEELTTSKEELQSLNEELHTVNAEMQLKLDELSRTNNDMQNLLNSTDIATVFLDNDLRIRRFTPQATKIIRLIPGDVGRPFSDISRDLIYPRLNDDAREVLRTLVSSEKQISSAKGRWFQVRITPYRTEENRIDGVAITFIDITVTKALEADLRERESQVLNFLESLPLLVWTCRPDGACDYLCGKWMEFTGVAQPQLLGYGWLNQLHPADRGRFKTLWEDSVAAGAAVAGEFRLRRQDGAHRLFKAQISPVRDAQGAIVKWYGCAIAEGGGGGTEAAGS